MAEFHANNSLNIIISPINRLSLAAWNKGLGAGLPCGWSMTPGSALDKAVFFSLLYIYIFVLFLCLFLITFFPLAFSPLFILLAHYSLARFFSAINVFLVMFI